MAAKSGVTDWLLSFRVSICACKFLRGFCTSLWVSGWLHDAGRCVLDCNV